MVELIQRARWDQAYDFLESGNPPMISRLLALNTVFLILYILRRAKGLKPLQQTGLLQVQALLIVANMLIMFQGSIQQFLGRFI